jgi:hypothetical protein
MLKVHVIMVALVIATAVHSLVALMALLSFMWGTAALASITAMIGLYVIDGLERTFYQ